MKKEEIVSCIILLANALLKDIGELVGDTDWTYETARGHCNSLFHLAKEIDKEDITVDCKAFAFMTKEELTAIKERIISASYDKMHSIREEPEYKPYTWWGDYAANTRSCIEIVSMINQELNNRRRCKE